MILLLGGTSDAAPLARQLAQAGYRVLVSQATDTPLAGFQQCEKGTQRVPGPHLPERPGGGHHVPMVVAQMGTVPFFPSAAATVSPMSIVSANLAPNATIDKPIGV